MSWARRTLPGRKEWFEDRQYRRPAHWVSAAGSFSTPARPCPRLAFLPPFDPLGNTKAIAIFASRGSLFALTHLDSRLRGNDIKEGRNDRKRAGTSEGGWHDRPLPLSCLRKQASRKGHTHDERPAGAVGLPCGRKSHRAFMHCHPRAGGGPGKYGYTLCQ